jgi:hypothetical protein
MFRTYAVEVRISDKAGKVVGLFEVHHADFLDSSFRETYKDLGWAADNLFRAKTSTHNSALSSLLEIQNHSQEWLRCIAVKAEDYVVAMDLAPAQTVSTLVSASPRTEEVGVAASICTPGRQNMYKSQAFAVRATAEGWHGRYRVSYHGDRFAFHVDTAAR